MLWLGTTLALMSYLASPRLAPCPLPLYSFIPHYMGSAFLDKSAVSWQADKLNKTCYRDVSLSFESLAESNNGTYTASLTFKLSNWTGDWLCNDLYLIGTPTGLHIQVVRQPPVSAHSKLLPSRPKYAMHVCINCPLVWLGNRTLRFSQASWNTRSRGPTSRKTKRMKCHSMAFGSL